mgnify:CR=1 FL=1
MFYPKRKRIMWVAYVMNLIVFTQLLIAVSNAVDHVINVVVFRNHDRAFSYASSPRESRKVF